MSFFKSVLFSVFFFSFSLLSFAQDKFPQGPDATLTPGSLCESRNTRHKEKISYCKRSVSSSDKWVIIERYNKKLGSNINQKNRGRFKIDHLIPLCIGGSNDHTNLWPQHETIYTQTDDIEHLTCALVSQGDMKQKEAIEWVLRAKHNLSESKSIKDALTRRLNRFL